MQDLLSKGFTAPSNAWSSPISVTPIFTKLSQVPNENQPVRSSMRRAPTAQRRQEDEDEEFFSADEDEREEGGGLTGHDSSGSDSGAKNKPFPGLGTHIKPLENIESDQELPHWSLNLYLKLLQEQEASAEFSGRTLSLHSFIESKVSESRPGKVSETLIMAVRPGLPFTTELNAGLSLSAFLLKSRDDGCKDALTFVVDSLNALILPNELQDALIQAAAMLLPQRVEEQQQQSSSNGGRATHPHFSPFALKLSVPAASLVLIPGHHKPHWALAKFSASAKGNGLTLTESSSSSGNDDESSLPKRTVSCQRILLPCCLIPPSCSGTLHLVMAHCLNGC